MGSSTERIFQMMLDGSNWHAWSHVMAAKLNSKGLGIYITLADAIRISPSKPTKGKEKETSIPEAAQRQGRAEPLAPILPAWKKQFSTT